MTHGISLPRIPLTAPSFLAMTILLAAGFVTPPTLEASPAATTIPETPSIWAAQGQFQSEQFGARVDGAGDVNGDGFADVIIGAPSPRGRAVVYLGSPTGLATSPAWSLEGLQNGSFLGTSVAGAGDVNGDGFGDVIVGELGFGDARLYLGRAWIIPGSRQGLRTKQAWTIAGDTEGESLGETVAGAGDVNGDGFDDGLIGSNTRTLVVLGRRGSNDHRTPAWVGPPALLSLGVGDVNRDGYDDVVLTGAETLLYLGSPSGLGREPSWRGPAAITASGGGDVNGDGYSDLVLTPGFNGGEVSVYLGSPQGLPLSPSWTLTDPSYPAVFRGEGFGLSVSIRGDANRDGFDDILVSQYRYHENLAFNPSVFCYLGKASGPSSRPDWAGRGNGISGSYGLNAAFCGDVNGDGDSEVLAADPGSFPGSARLFHLGKQFPAPRIEHESINFWNEGEPIVLDAAVTDHTDTVSRVEILHHSVYDSDFLPPIAMEGVEGDRYRGTIPGASVRAGLVYFIRATDNYGLAMRTLSIEVDLNPASAVTPRTLSFGVRVGAASGGKADRLLLSTTRPGPASVRLFDVQGRLAGTLLDTRNLENGMHVLSLSGATFLHASGVYFYRVDTADGTRSGRFVILH